VTGLMARRDIDFGVDGSGLSSDLAWEAVGPLLRRCSELRDLDDRDARRERAALEAGVRLRRISGLPLDARTVAERATIRP